MRYFYLLTLLTALICQTTYAKCRRMARPNSAWPALQNILAPGNNILGSMSAQTRNRRLPVETAVPNNLKYMRSPQKPCQLQQSYPRVMPEMRITESRIPETRIPEMARMIEMPRAQYVQNMPAGSVITEPAMFSINELLNTPLGVKNVPEVISMPINIQEMFERPCVSPKGLVNPFLPAASPVSAWAPPTSNLLPPISPGQARTHFLRKIPIPPPTL